LIETLIRAIYYRIVGYGWK